VSFYSRYPAIRNMFTLSISMLVLLLVNLTGCSRSFYRKQADHEALFILNEKGNDERWRMNDFSINIDPKSRMYMDYDPDNPPMPPDDPAAAVFMEEVDGMKGYEDWGKNGNLESFENSEWRKHLPLAEDGKLYLDSNKAFELALLHSPSYQGQLEQMYLSALDVSAERFDFDTQFYGGYGGAYRTRGSALTGSPATDLSLQTRGIQMRQKYASGATAIVNFANSLMWQLSGSDSFGTNTLLDVNIVQPLLRQGGKDRVLEILTRSERQLLYQVRSYQRYRKGFYMDITTGQGAGGISRIGGLFGGSGLSGFTGVGSGGFGGIGGFRGGGGGASFAGGYLGLLQSQKGLVNQRANIVALKGSLKLFESFFEAGFTDFNNVQTTKAQFYREITSLIDRESNYDGQLDGFINEIGLPPDIEVVINGNELEQFNLIDEEMQGLQNDILDQQDNVGQIINSSLRNEQPQLLATDWSTELEQGLKDLREQAILSKKLLDQLSVESAAARKDVEKLKEIVPQRKAAIEVLREQIKDNPLVPESALNSDLLDGTYLDKLPGLLEADLNDIDQRLQAKAPAIILFRDNIDELLKTGSEMDDEQLYQNIEDKIISKLPELLIKLANDALELSLVLTSARAETITLIPVDLSIEEAYETASKNRLDWMNERAGVMDQYRLLAFNADNLESDLSLQLSGSIGNTGDDPFRFRDTTGTLRAGLAWDAPITRLRERNIYRQSLLEYQGRLRAYYRYEDQQYLSFKNSLRSIILQKINFEASRKQLQVATRNVLFQRTKIQEPPGQLGNSLSPETAQRLIGSLQGLQGAQDALLAVWVGYEINRSQLDFALGTMQIDENGIWIDPGAIGAIHGYPSQEPPNTPSDEEDSGNNNDMKDDPSEDKET
tara:strand:+ start:2281 stop:4953 length:2673 start_codon:yes stop_codon:yes gene_type:complete